MNLRDALLDRASPSHAPINNENFREKWERLVVLTQPGPVWLWLVSEGARWSYLVRAVGTDDLEITPLDEPPIWERMIAMTER